ncbi:hypothetical protein LCGC14_2166080, partial [marine sediment metagenome]
AYTNMDTYLTELHEDGKLNGNVLVTKKKKIIFEKSFGYTDGSKTTKLNKDYRFNIGSIYKEFPAVAIMQLKEKDLIDLEDSVSKYLSDLPEWSRKVSIKNLLQYTSGLPKIGWTEYFANGINITESHILDEIKHIKNLEFEPGSDYLYSNSNPILLIKIIEQVTGSNFYDYVQNALFEPLKLNGSVFKNQYPYIDRSLMAIPFDTDFKEDNYKIAVESLLLSSTARDMAIWFEQLAAFTIIDKAAVQLLSEWAKVGSNIQAPLGFGEWINDRFIEHTHHGSSGNYECIVRRFKENDITIAILTNQKHGNVYEISDTLYKIVKQNP